MDSAELELRRLQFKNTGQTDGQSYQLSDITRRAGEWDRVVKTSHLVNCWYNWHCLMNVFVKDGLVIREEQAANYPPPNDPQVPDLNPRGCQKGTCYSQYMYAPNRLKYPLKRLGARGDGKWQRITWEQALKEIADKIVEVLATEGNQRVLWMGGTHGGGTGALGGNNLLSALDLPAFNTSVDTSDEHPGLALTWGKTMAADSPGNWFYSDMLFIWGSNPAYTQITNFHYIAEARYNGTRIVVITPDFNASARYADVWVPINIGTDAALALAMAQVIVEKKLYQAEFIQEQTDLPLLVRSDNGKYLTQKDIKRGGREDIFYVVDAASGRIEEAPYASLSLGKVVPELEREHEVNTLRGKVRVRPVFALLKEHLNKYTPEMSSQITGVPPKVIHQLAIDFATAKGVVNMTGSGWGKFYHGDLIERAQVLLYALCGHIGRKGATYNGYPALVMDSEFSHAVRRGSASIQSASGTDPRFATWRNQGYTDEMILFEYLADFWARGTMVNPVLLYYYHAGLRDLIKDNNSWDPNLKRPIDSYVNEAIKRGWQLTVLDPQKPPRILLEIGGSFLRRSRSSKNLVSKLLPQVELLMSIDTRMSSTCMYADYVLPAAAWYEKTAIAALQTPIVPYVHAQTQCVPPLGEAKGEWEMWCLLAKALEASAKARGITGFKDRFGKTLRLDNLYDKLTSGGMYTPEDEEAVARDFLVNSTNIATVDWEDFKERGIAPFTAVGMTLPSCACDIVPGEPVIPLTKHTEKKVPYPTYTRRMQFYIDHDWFQELGEALPVHKDNPKMGGDYPLQLTGGHARWSVHSTWSDDPMMLRLQRGEPIMYMSAPDAQSRGIKDEDEVVVYNDVASFHVRVLVSPSVKPGQVIIYHGWENFQFKGKEHFKGVMPQPINPVELVGGYYQIRPAPRYACQPGANDRGTRVEVRKA